MTSPAQASADGGYSWFFEGYHPTYESCVAAVQRDAYRWRCDPADTTNQ